MPDAKPLGLRLPFFEALEASRKVLIAGAGGGFDIFCGLPLYFALRAAGKEVHLGSLSFSNLLPEAGRHLLPNLVEVNADSSGSRYYFPEQQLSSWFREQGEEVPIYCIHRTGPRPVMLAYVALLNELGVDTIILVDGGTDSLMRGDEGGIGTPVEDVSSIAAVESLPVERKLLACLGFGIDFFHGVCHAQVLEAIAELDRSGDYLGAFSLLRSMPEVERFRQATEFVLKRTPDRESIVCSSLLSALEGRFGDYHRNKRTDGSELFINPLMGLYWCFHVEAIAKRILYLDGFRRLDGFMEATMYIEQFRNELRVKKAIRPARDIPI
jgi:hypothetical protein